MNHVQRLLDAVHNLHEPFSALRGFAPWPDDLSERNISPRAVPVTSSLATRDLTGTAETQVVIDALLQAACDLEWRQTYSEDQVGAHFLQNYGFVELYGPTGHFHSDQLRGYLGFWGPGLTYDWHRHEAEELYFNLSGSAAFTAPGLDNVLLLPGQSRMHSSNQPHLMMTLDQPFLTYALWRGAGMAKTAKMVAT